MKGSKLRSFSSPIILMVFSVTIKVYGYNPMVKVILFLVLKCNNNIGKRSWST